MVLTQAALNFGTSGAGLQLPAGVTFSTFLSAATQSQVTISAGATFSFDASNTGKKYDVQTLAFVSSSGGGVNKYPGTIAGTTANGGLYV
jgi:hypothetical protein